MPKTSEAEWDDGPSLFEIAIRYWWLLLISALACGAALFFFAQSGPATYAATSSLLLEEPEAGGVFVEGVEGDHERYVQNQVQRLQSRDVASRAARLVGEGTTPAEIAGSIALDVAVDSDQVSITATAASPERAAAIANAVGEAYQDTVREQVREKADAAIAELETTKAGLRRDLRTLDQQAAQVDDPSVQAQRDAFVTQVAELQARQDEIRIQKSLFGSGVEFFERAEPPIAPQGRGEVRLAALGVLLGLALGTAIAWFLASREDNADRRQDPAAILQAPLLGAVPDFKGLDITGALPTVTDPRSPAAEAYQFVVALLSTQFSGRDGSSVILVTSPQPGDGKTVTAVNLAVAASRDEREVLLVDGDARVAGLSRLIGVEDGGPGLHELQQDPENLVWSQSRRDMPNVPAVEVVPVGSEIADPAGFFRTTGFASAIRRIRDYADFVVIDTPPLLAVSDTAAVAEHVDGIVLVIPQGTSITILEEVRERLALINTPLLGYIFNRADSRSAPYAYRYDRYTSSSRTRDRAFSAKATAQPLP